MLNKANFVVGLTGVFSGGKGERATHAGAVSAHTAVLPRLVLSRLPSWINMDTGIELQYTKGT